MRKPTTLVLWAGTALIPLLALARNREVVVRDWEDQYTEENSFHIFKVKLDGSHLAQLTAGNQNDFDPCYLPGGRIAFISTRTDTRGPGQIYSRCFPDRGPAQFFLHSMNADGSDIIPLSFHETDEWHFRAVPRSAG